MKRTPAHAVTQAVLRKHQRDILSGRQLERRIYLTDAVLPVKRLRLPIGNVAQIGQSLFREGIVGEA